MTFTRTGIASLLLLAATASPGAAQLVSTLDLGGSSVRYGDSVSASAATVSPAFRAEGPLASFSGTGTLSMFQTGSWTTNGSLAASLFTPAFHLFRLEGTGSLGGSAHEDFTRTGQMLARGRLHLMSESLGAWLGAGGGRTWDGATWRDISIAEAGAWARHGSATLLATVTPARVDQTVRYTDTEAAVRWAAGAVELSGSAGFRSGEQLPGINGASWGGLSGTLWIARRVALVAAGGTYPVDYTQGYPGGRYGVLTLRIASHAPAWRDEQRLGAAQLTQAGEAPAFDVRSAPGGARTLRVHAPAARSVELAGDFTDWRPLAMTRTSGGWWELTLRVQPGMHQMNVRQDGGEWGVPRGVTSITDEFNGVVGVVLVR